MSVNKNFIIRNLLPEMYPRVVQYSKGVYYDGSGLYYPL